MTDRELPDCLLSSPIAAELVLPRPFDMRDDEHIDLVAGQLLRRFRHDDDGPAFELLVELCLGRLLEVAQSLVRRYGRVLDAEDLTARFLERLFVEPRRDDADVRRFLGMAFQTMRYDALNQLRLHTRARRRSVTWEESQESRRTVPDPAYVVSERDQADALLGPACVLLAVAARCFADLRPHDRTILFQREIEGLSYDDLAEVLDIPRSQVGMILKRARERFLDHLVKTLRRANALASPSPAIHPSGRAAPRGHRSHSPYTDSSRAEVPQ